MLDGFKKLFRRSAAPPAGPTRWFHRADPGEPSEPASARRWTGAQTHRMNQHQWVGAIGATLNEDLESYLDELRNRCGLEAARNEYVKGIIQSHVIDMIGASGPTLHVQSDSDRYNDWLEGQWRDWFGTPDLGLQLDGYTGPDYNGRLSGVDFLSLWVRNDWTCGEHLFQFVDDPDAPTPIKMRLLGVHPRRLATPAARVADDILMGVKVTKTGRPVAYFVGEPDIQPYRLGTEYTEIPASGMIHAFLAEEDGQVRGVPWLATALQPAADLREYDEHVLDAADQAAALGLAWFTNHPEAPYFEINETTEIRRGQQWTGPPGWQPMQINPTQPATGYTDFRKERLAGLGRPVCMPMLLVRLTAERHTYSSARIDLQLLYQSALAWYQGWLARTSLNPCLVRLAREAELAAASGRINRAPKRPPRVRLSWTWPKMPHVDPKKEGDGERTQLENGTLPFTDACAARGLDEDYVIEAWKRTNAKLVAAGAEPLPSPMAYLSAKAAAEADAAGQQDDNDEQDDEQQEGDDNDA